MVHEPRVRSTFVTPRNLCGISFAKMAMLLRSTSRLSLALTSRTLRPACILMQSAPSVSSSSAKEDFWMKNERLKRPMSPHLTIYSPQLTSMLSITHRGTGVAMTCVTTGFALCALVLPDNFEHYLNLIKNLNIPPSAILGFKTLLAWPLCYHSANGVRHLAWDMGHGFTISTLYKSGWLVFFSSFLTAASLAYFL